MDIDRRRRLMRRLAWSCVLLMLVVTSASAWLRLAQPRPACTDWPSCRSTDRPALRVATPAVMGDPGTMALVRGTHRVAASAVLLAVLAAAWLALAWRPRQRAEGALAVALSTLALALSVLGIVTPGSRAAGVLLGNLLGGLAMLGLAWSLTRRLQSAPATDGPLARAALAGAGLWAAQAALGALAGARLAEAAPNGHLALALLAAPWALGVGWWAHRQGRRREGATLMAAAVVQVVLGRAAAAWAADPAAVLAHNVVAGVGLAMMLGLALGSGREARAAAAAAIRAPRDPVST
jgi:cytochrome c oxidase assembly protein subunit 15